MTVFQIWSSKWRHKMQTNVFQTMLVIIYWDFLTLYQIFLSPQVKGIVNISNKHFIYNFYQELPNILRLRILGKWNMLRRSQIFIDLDSSAQSSIKNENFVHRSEKLFKNWSLTFLVEHYFTLGLKFVSYILARIASGKRTLLLTCLRPPQN